MPRKNKGPYLAPGKAGNYDIAWTESGRSRRRSTGTPDFRLAQKILANFILLDDKERAELTRPKDVLLVADILGDPDAPPLGPHEPPREDYWHEHCLERVVSLETQRAALIRMRDYFGHMVVSEVKPADVADFIKKRRLGIIGEPSGNGTIGRELSVLVAAVQHAIKAKRLKVDDAPTVTLPQKPPPKDRWLTREEAGRLLEAAQGNRKKLSRTYRFIVLALGTASRKTAIVTLKRDQIDLENGMIYLNPRGRNQTAKRRPEVPISDWLRPMLVQILEEAEGDHLLDWDGSIRTGFENAVARAGLEGVTAHTLRHTWATWAAQSGMPMVDIAGVLGDSIQTVLRNYLHHSPEHLRSAVNSVEMPALTPKSA